jgi:hypothetical protein
VDVEQAGKIINAVEPGWHVVAVAVPTRGLRMIRDELALIFRIEQLDARTMKWRPVSTHTGDEAWESLGPALGDLQSKQARLKEKIKLALHEKRMAMIKAQNPVPFIGDE